MTVSVQSETRERFLLAIAREIPVDRIEAVHLFQPVRLGGVESGVAVIAAQEPPAQAETAPSSDAAGAQGPTGAWGGLDDVAQKDDFAPSGRSTPDRMLDERSAPHRPDEAARRFTVYTALYRLTLKGPERGEWETAVVAEADAPLLTVDAVVRGVQRRAGDMEAVDRMSGAELREILDTADRAARR